MSSKYVYGYEGPSGALQKEFDRTLRGRKDVLDEIWKALEPQGPSGQPASAATVPRVKAARKTSAKRQK
jgi:hypothetical protein